MHQHGLRFIANRARLRLFRDPRNGHNWDKPYVADVFHRNSYTPTSGGCLEHDVPVVDYAGQMRFFFLVEEAFPLHLDFS